MGKTIWTPTDPLESGLRAGTSSFLPHFFSEASDVNEPRSKKWENQLYLIGGLAAKSPGKRHRPGRREPSGAMIATQQPVT